MHLLEDVEEVKGEDIEEVKGEDVEEVKEKTWDLVQPSPSDKTWERIKIHPILEFEQEEEGKTECFLQKIREIRKNAMGMLKQWTSKDQGDKVTVFLLQSLLTGHHTIKH